MTITSSEAQFTKSEQGPRYEVLKQHMRFQCLVQYKGKHANK